MPPCGRLQLDGKRLRMRWFTYMESVHKSGRPAIVLNPWHGVRVLAYLPDSSQPWQLDALVLLRQINPVFAGIAPALDGVDGPPAAWSKQESPESALNIPPCRKRCGRSYVAPS